MIRVAIVGNIACGKTEVEKILSKEGYPVLDTDVVCHRLLDENTEVFSEGKISREKLGKLVFNDEKLKLKLESILHPKVNEKIKEYFKNNEHYDIAFVSIPLLFETHMEKLFDKILFIYTDDSIRLGRLIKRNNYTKEYALLRMDSQSSQDEKIGKSDIVIYNNSTIEDLKTNVINSIGQIR